MTASRRVRAGCLAFFAISLPAAIAAEQFKLVDLPGSAAAGSRAYGLNNAGQTVGWSTINADVRHGTLWNGEVVTDLHGTVHLALEQLYDKNYTETYAISDDDQIVGTARKEVKCGDRVITISTAFILRPAVLSDLATPYPGDALVELGSFGNPCEAFDSAAVGISNRSHVVGWADLGDGTVHAFIVTPVAGSWYRDSNADFANDYMIDLGTLDDRSTVSSATSVNDSGQVTGYSYTTSFTYNGDSAYHAFLVTPESGQWFIDSNFDGINDLMFSLGTLGGPNSWGRDINNDGAVVGEADTASYDTHAFIYTNSQIGDLGTLGGRNSSASAINNQGDVVGWAENESGQRRAFLYRNGKMFDLNSMLIATDVGAVALTEARDINDAGDIVGWAQTVSGTEVVEIAFRLRAPTTAEIAEAEALIAAQQSQVNGATANSHGEDTSSNGDNGGDGVYIGGTPNTLGGSTNNGGNTDDDGAIIDNAAVGACGAGMTGLLPLTMLAMLGLKRR